MRVSPGLRFSKTQFDMAALAAYIEACFDCAQACTACADACLGEQDTAMLRRCIRLDLDCADLCAATGSILSRQTATDPAMVSAALQACAQACKLCGDECEQHGQHGMEHCRVCAEACRRAASSPAASCCRRWPRNRTPRATHEPDAKRRGASPAFSHPLLRGYSVIARVPANAIPFRHAVPRYSQRHSSPVSACRRSSYSAKSISPRAKRSVGLSARPLLSYRAVHRSRSTAAAALCHGRHRGFPR